MPFGMEPVGAAACTSMRGGVARAGTAGRAATSAARTIVRVEALRFEPTPLHTSARVARSKTRTHFAAGARERSTRTNGLCKLHALQHRHGLGEQLACG